MKKVAKACVMLLTMGIVAVMVAGPAAATGETGAGAVLTGTWTDDGPDCGGTCTPPVGGPLCGGGVSSTSAAWDQYGTYTAKAVLPGISAGFYAGPTRATMTSSGRYDFGPLGSYAPNTSCLGAPTYSVPSTHVDVVSVPAGSVSCSLDGSFNRAQVTTVVVTVSGNCKVGGTTTSVTQAFTLNVAAVPDFGPPQPPPPPITIAGVNYTET